MNEKTIKLIKASGYDVEEIRKFNKWLRKSYLQSTCVMYRMALVRGKGKNEDRRDKQTRERAEKLWESFKKDDSAPARAKAVYAKAVYVKGEETVEPLIEPLVEPLFEEESAEEGASEQEIIMAAIDEVRTWKLRTEITAEVLKTLCRFL